MGIGKKRNRTRGEDTFPRLLVPVLTVSLFSGEVKNNETRRVVVRNTINAPLLAHNWLLSKFGDR